MEDYKKIAEKLRYTKSESKRKLLDEAADTIERLEAERNELAIAALREQEERSKGCEFCMTSVWQNANYCPRCGRKLEVEG